MRLFTQATPRGSGAGFFFADWEGFFPGATEDCWADPATGFWSNPPGNCEGTVCCSLVVVAVIPIAGFSELVFSTGSFLTKEFAKIGGFDSSVFPD
jgi:hypothetical protein